MAVAGAKLTSAFLCVCADLYLRWESRTALLKARPLTKMISASCPLLEVGWQCGDDLHLYYLHILGTVGMWYTQKVPHQTEVPFLYCPGAKCDHLTWRGRMSDGKATLNIRLYKYHGLITVPRSSGVYREISHDRGILMTCSCTNPR